MQEGISTATLVLIAASGGAGAVVAGLVSALVSLHAESRQEKRSREEWRRNAKMEAYTEFLSAARFMINKYTRVSGLQERELLNFNTSEHKVSLLLPTEERERFAKLFQRLDFPDSEKDWLRKLEPNSTVLLQIRELLRTDLGAS